MCAVASSCRCCPERLVELEVAIGQATTGGKFRRVGIDQRRCKFSHSFDLHVAVLQQPLIFAARTAQQVVLAVVPETPQGTALRIGSALQG